MSEVKTVQEVQEKAAEIGHPEISGKLVLVKPIKDGEQEYKELSYDFDALTGQEYTAALDRDPNARSAFRLTNKQGLALFAAAAAKKTGGLDATDIMSRMGANDAVKAVQIAAAFFNITTRAGDARIMSE